MMRQAWLFAYASVASFLLGFVTIALFFSFGGVWGPLNDFTGGFLYSVLTIPVALALHQVLRPKAFAASTVALAIGLIAFTLFAISSILIILKGSGILDFFEFRPGTGPYGVGLIAPVLLGVWLVLVRGLSRKVPELPRRFAWSAALAGVGWIWSISGFAAVGLESPLLALAGVGYALTIVFYTLWGVWIGRWFRRSIPAGTEPRASAA